MIQLSFLWMVVGNVAPPEDHAHIIVNAASCGLPRVNRCVCVYVYFGFVGKGEGWAKGTTPFVF